MLEGDISIGLVTVNERAEGNRKELVHCQEIQESPHIRAMTEVARIIDEHSVYARSSISDENVLIEFEDAVGYNLKTVSQWKRPETICSCVLCRWKLFPQHGRCNVETEL